MEEFLLTPKEKLYARIALLRFYSSQCVACGLYLVALAFGFFNIVLFAEFIVLPLFLPEFSQDILYSFVLSGYTVVVIYVLGQTFFWWHLRGAVMEVKPKREDELEGRSEGTTVTFLQLLHMACFDCVKEKHRISAKLSTLRTAGLSLMWFNLFVAFLIVFLVS